MNTVKKLSIFKIDRNSLVLLTLGFLVRLVTALWPQSFTFDEQVSLFFAQINVVEALYRDNAPPLFSVLLRVWQQIVPLSENYLRLLPFLISCFTLLYVFRRWGDFWTRVLFVINPASISFAGELKNSSLFELFSVLFIGEGLRFYSSLKANDKVSVRSYGIILLSALGLVLTHYLGLVLLFSGLVFLSLEKKIPHKIRTIFFSVTISIALLMFMINSYWIHGNSLAWMQNIHQEKWSLDFLLPLYVLGSYSRTWTAFLIAFIFWQAYRKKSIEAVWFIMLLAFYFVIELLTNRLLGFRRFIIPLEILSILSVTQYFPLDLKNKRWIGITLVWGLCIQGKKVVEDVTQPKSGWKEASQLYCSSSASYSVKLTDHEGQRFYFPESCAEIIKSCRNDLPKKTIWLVQKQSLIYFQELQKKCSPQNTITLAQTVGSESSEPILIFEIIKNE